MDAPLVMYSGAGTGSKQYYLADERGSVVARTDANGNALGTVAYGPYGEGADPGTTRFGYTGQMALEGTGLYYFRARVYAPSLGRFLEPDPIGFAGGLNLYAYTGGDPINFTDPTGLLECRGGEDDEPGLPGGFVICGPSRSGRGFSVPKLTFGGIGDLLSAPFISSGDALSQFFMQQPEKPVEKEKKKDGRMCLQDPPIQALRDLARAANFLGAKVTDTGTGLIIAGSVGGAEGFAILGPAGSGPGLFVIEKGVELTIIGSGIITVSGIVSFVLGDRRAGTKAILDGLGGRALRRIPDEFAPVTNSALDALEDHVIDFLRARGADIRDCK